MATDMSWVSYAVRKITHIADNEGNLIKLLVWDPNNKEPEWSLSRAQLLKEQIPERWLAYIFKFDPRLANLIPLANVCFNERQHPTQPAGER
jgi:hypothetical protein